ncbi:uncharacterized acetyltransferase At3g50280 [Amborella trichopoda]|uniref:uncharacterized acetyltransferase At3g50280 n=1 Tax=Amborella trichopoda TaxID=13333 RepID=UPI0009BFBD6A|nr:uncharacterized acetyltransferase At3g50280 [Amborella trichopoda]|eukprot:XP_020526633.1 uncharacterized acetyltransferase At3g50280 [Amborella trichopoda]
MGDSEEGVYSTQAQDLAFGVPLPQRCRRRFLHAKAIHITLNDILGSPYVPLVVRSFFVNSGAMSHEGRFLPLLARFRNFYPHCDLQSQSCRLMVTELADSLFIECSFNHVVGDGTSFWNFLNSWSELSRYINDKGEAHTLSPPPAIEWLYLATNHLVCLNPPIDSLPLPPKPSPSPFYDRLFYFPAHSISHLKDKANSQNLEVFQALYAHVWRAITRACDLSGEQETWCALPVSYRSRVVPPLSPYFFGNAIRLIFLRTTSGELLGRDLGWGANLIQDAIAKQTNEEICSWLEANAKAPTLYDSMGFTTSPGVVMGNSPRFDVYGNDFGWGLPLGVHVGYDSRFDGNFFAFPAREGRGSTELHFYMNQNVMAALERYKEFMEAVEDKAD